MADFKVVILDHRYEHYDQERNVLSEIGVRPIVCYPETDAEAAEILRDADAVICNLYPLTADLIRGMEKCRVISRYGVGYDNVDAKAAADCGIALCNVPDYAMEDASDHAIALLFACARKISYHDRKIREGRWNLHQDQPCYRMSGKVLGVIGFGHIGSTLVRKLSGFGFSEILIDSPGTDPALIGVAGGVKTDLDQLLNRSDFVSIHCPLNDETRDMFDKAAFEKMKDGAILINTARGPIVNEDELYKALASGKIASAGLDVYNEEPLGPESPLRTLENIIMTDHTAWYSEESIVELKIKAAKNVVEVLSGKKPSFRVN